MNISEIVDKVKNAVKREEYNYFEFFIDMMGFASEAAALLEQILIGYDYEKLSESIRSIHEVEHSADLIKHTMMERLLKEFLPPIDREDIIKLAHVLDNVVDSIDDIIQHMYMYDVRTCRGEAVQFSRIIRRCCAAMTDLMASFADFKKSTDMYVRIVEINNLEEEGDALFISSIHTLFTDGTSGAELLAWNEILGLFEGCCDDCENVADVIEEILLKNT